MIGQLSNYWWVFILLGVCAGVISGALGLGSGTIVIPTLVLVCGLGQKSAQGTALAVMVPMALLGALRYWKNPEIELSGIIIVLIVLGALAGVLIGTALAFRMPERAVQKIFAVFLAIVAVKMFTVSRRPQQQGPGESLTNQKNVNLAEPGGIKNEATKQ
jgi:uncharacterized membrane protein YfcA